MSSPIDHIIKLQLYTGHAVSATSSRPPNHWLRTVKLLILCAHSPSARSAVPIPRSALHTWSLADEYATDCHERAATRRRHIAAELVDEFQLRERLHQQKRMQALKENNADEYLRHVSAIKLSSLLSIMETTHKFMLELGAKLTGSRSDGALGQCVDPLLIPDEVERFRAFVNATKSEYQLVHHHSVVVDAQPDALHATLMPHQMVGLTFLSSLHANNINGILADEMGVGKTLQTLAFLTRLKETRRARGPHLVLAPLSIVREWQESAAQFIPTLKVVLFDDLPAGDVRTTSAEFDMVLLALHRVGKLAAELKRVQWDFIVVDEAHKAVSNPSTATSQSICSLPYKSRLVLTGTPLNNDIQELWSLLNFLNPKVFGNQASFEDVFRRPFAGCASDDATSLNDEERQVLVLRMHQILRPFMLRRTKRDIDTSLSITFHEIRCPQSWLQQHLLSGLRSSCMLPAVLSSGEFSTRHVTTKESVSQTVCNHPYHVPFFVQALSKRVAPGERLDELLSGNASVTVAGKLAVLDTLLLRLAAVGRKAVVFSHFLDTIELLESHLDTIGFSDRYVTLTGSTSVDERKEFVHKFRTDASVVAFILSVKAGGCGLNLQVADVVIMIDRDYTATNEDQAIARVFRMGQKNTVRAIYLTTSDPSEQRIMEIAERKNRPRLAIIEAGDFQNGVEGLDADDRPAAALQEPLSGSRLHVVDLTTKGSDGKDSMLAAVRQDVDPLLCGGSSEVAARLSELDVLGPAVAQAREDTPTEILLALAEVEATLAAEATAKDTGRGFRKRNEDVWFGEPTDAFVAKWAEAGLDECEIDEKWADLQRKKLQKREAALLDACEIAFPSQAHMCDLSLNALAKHQKALHTGACRGSVVSTGGHGLEAGLFSVDLSHGAVDFAQLA